jgi:hypothetical protein
LFGRSTVFFLVGVAAFWAASGTCANAQFENRAGFPTPNKIPYSATLGDFNRDGILDLAVVSYLPTGTVSIWLGSGDGTFRLGETYAVAVQPFYASAAILRGNGILDLVVGDSLSDDVYVMLGNGDGTFQAAIAYPTVGRSFTVSTGDFTGDGVLDLIVLGEPAAECNCIEVLPGNGDGTFQSAVVTPVPYNIDGYALASGYFNTDKKLDVAVTGVFGSAVQVDILLGNGDGTFRPNGFYPLVISPNSIVAGNFRGGQKTDLAVTVDTGVEVLLGNGDGSFQQPVLYPTRPPTWVIAEDFNGDGRLDLAVANPALTGYLPGASVLTGNGDGTFQTPNFYPSGGKAANFVDSADFNRDGKPDLVITDDSSEGFVTLLNTGVVTFSPTTPLAFKKQAVGTKSAAQKVTLTNTGKTELKISAMKASAQFGLTTTCHPNVASGANCTISITFSPTSKGAKSGTVTINDSASSKPMVIELSGTGS